MKASYYWLILENGCIKYVRTCHHCQVYQNRKNVPPQPLHSLAAPWPFLAWGMDVIGPMIPKASNGHEYILVAIDYFTKSMEAASYRSVTQAVVARFLKQNIIFHYSALGKPIIDNGKNRNGKMIEQLCQQFKIEHQNSVPYRP